jgi:hypothetical protein
VIHLFTILVAKFRLNYLIQVTLNLVIHLFAIHMAKQIAKCRVNYLIQVTLNCVNHLHGLALNHLRGLAGGLHNKIDREEQLHEKNRCILAIFATDHNANKL